MIVGPKVGDEVARVEQGKDSDRAHLVRSPTCRRRRSDNFGRRHHHVGLFQTPRQDFVGLVDHLRRLVGRCPNQALAETLFEGPEPELERRLDRRRLVHLHDGVVDEARERLGLEERRQKR